MFLSLWLFSPCRLDQVPVAFISWFLPLVTLNSDSSSLPAGPLFASLACVAVLSNEDPSVVPGGAAGMSIHPWTQRLPGGVFGLWSALATAAAATANLQHYGECSPAFHVCSVCVCVCMCVTVSRRESLLIRTSTKCLVNTAVCLCQCGYSRTEPSSRCVCACDCLSNLFSIAITESV